MTRNKTKIKSHGGRNRINSAYAHLKGFCRCPVESLQKDKKPIRCAMVSLSGVYIVR